jgi:hypothetical protein
MKLKTMRLIRLTAAGTMLASTVLASPSKPIHLTNTGKPATKSAKLPQLPKWQRISMDKLDGLHGPTVVRLAKGDSAKLQRILQRSTVSFITRKPNGTKNPLFHISCANKGNCTVKIWEPARCEFDDSRFCSISAGHFFPDESVARKLYEKMDMQARSTTSRGTGGRYTTQRLEKNFTSMDKRFSLNCAMISSQDEFTDSSATDYTYCEVRINGIPRQMVESGRSLADARR